MSAKKTGSDEVFRFTAKVKAKSMQVRALDDVHLRPIASENARTRIRDWRVGLPERVTAGSYGPFEAGLDVGGVVNPPEFLG